MRWTYGLISSAVVLVGHSLVGCSNLADDCVNTSSCASGGGASSAGSSGKSGAAGNSSGGGDIGGNAGSTTGGNSGTSGSGTSGDAGTTGLGGEGGTASQPCDGACTEPTPVCKVATDTCVECLAPGDCTTDSEKLCNPASNTCVQCLAAADCDTATASRCDGGECVECENNDDCAHIAGKGVCDGGECVQCTTTDESACAGKSCNPATNACTNTNASSVGTCKPCLADSECVGGNQADPDARCVPMEFNGTARTGGFCLRRAAKICRRPYTIAISSPSLSGAIAENYCGIDQENVTCEAVVDLEDSRTCEAAGDSACGCVRNAAFECVGAGQGGLCRDFAVLQDQCTYECGVTNDCPAGKQCLGSPTKFCQ